MWVNDVCVGRISNGLIISPQKVKKVSSYDTHEKLVLSSLPHTQMVVVVCWLVGLEGCVWVVLVVRVGGACGACVCGTDEVKQEWCTYTQYSTAGTSRQSRRASSKQDTSLKRHNTRGGPECEQGQVECSSNKLGSTQHQNTRASRALLGKSGCQQG